MMVALIATSGFGASTVPGIPESDYIGGWVAAWVSVPEASGFSLRLIADSAVSPLYIGGAVFTSDLTHLYNTRFALGGSEARFTARIANPTGSEIEFDESVDTAEPRDWGFRTPTPFAAGTYLIVSWVAGQADQWRFDTAGSGSLLAVATGEEAVLLRTEDFSGAAVVYGENPFGGAVRAAIGAREDVNAHASLLADYIVSSSPVPVSMTVTYLAVERGGTTEACPCHIRDIAPPASGSTQYRFLLDTAGIEPLGARILLSWADVSIPSLPTSL